MKLTKEQIVRTALRLLDEVGLDGLTLRRIATELGVQAPALYWHVKNKGQLLDELATLLVTDAIARLPDDHRELPRDWRAALRMTAHLMRRMMLLHRDGAKVIAGTYLTGPLPVRPEDVVLPLLTDAGLSTRQAVSVRMSVYHYTVGFVIEEQEMFPMPGQRDPRYAVDALAAQSSDRDPEILAATFGDDPEERFALGVELLISGAAAWIGDRTC